MESARIMAEVVVAEQVTQVAMGAPINLQSTVVQIVVGVIVGLLSPHIHRVISKKREQRKKNKGV